MRPNPFQRRATVPSGYTTSPLTFVRGTSMEYIVDPEERGRAAPGVGIYHVTTNLPAVLAEGRLRSRAELRKGGVASAGLGGGVGDERPDLVSTGMTLDGSLRVMRAVRVMADAVHGRIDNQNALIGLLDSLGPTLSALEDAMDWLSEETSGWEENRAVELYEEEIARCEDDVHDATSGPELYDALVRYEIEVAEAFTQWAAQGWLDDDAVACAMPVGFTEPAHKFERVLPENVGMVQLAARRGASVDRVPGECELRFRPEDLTIVAVWASEPTPRVRRQKRNPVAAPDSAAFRRWFGASKVVNARGEPRVMYHGTHADFEVFDTSGTQRARSFGAMFTPSKAYAANYGRKEYGGKVLAVYLRIENPFDAKNKKHEREWEAKRLPQEGWVQYAHRAGYDGAITMLNEYVVFDPRQVKSATANVGTFAPEDPSILRNPAKSPRAPKPPRTFRDLGAWTDWARTQGMTLRLSRAGYGPVEVTDLYADVVGTGAGSRVMEALVAAADQQGMPLRLTPSGKRNITFYERFGFTVGRTAHDTAMHRTPRRRNGRGARAATTKAYRDLKALGPRLQDRIYAYFDPLPHMDGANEMLAAMLREAGYRVLGVGGTRVVVDVGDGFAAKVAAEEYGNRANRNEYAFWKAHPLPDIMPVHDISQDGIVLLTERAETPVSETAAILAANRLAKHPEGARIGETDFDFQWGRHRGKVKLLDYGDVHRTPTGFSRRTPRRR